MRNILFVIFMFLGIIVFSQTKYQYVIKIDSITNVNKEVTVWLQGMFSATPVYDSATKYFRINSDFDISQSLFTQKVSDKNYTLLIFNKTGLVTDDPKNDSPK